MAVRVTDGVECMTEKPKKPETVGEDLGWNLITYKGDMIGRGIRFMSLFLVCVF